MCSRIPGAYGTDQDCQINEYVSSLNDPQAQTYRVAAWLNLVVGSILGRNVALQVLNRGGDDGERSQRKDCEERETHCDRVENQKTGGWWTGGRIYTVY